MGRLHLKAEVAKVKGGGEAIEATSIQAQWWAKYAGGKD